MASSASGFSVFWNSTNGSTVISSVATISAIQIA
jgi:hypothetical protein